ncbi:MAG: chromosomal replication initiator protein DnaA [Bacteroidetes bacterium QS_8_68_15]|nr:MAG: chromosomal replication initiator protein DnaA [Bacteroidetes bacterium QS_8_68_15]
MEPPDDDDASASPEDVSASPAAETAWQSCLEIIRDNISRQSYKTWFEPLEAQSLEKEDGVQRLTVQLPSRFYYEWLEEHYFGLLRKTVTKVLGDDGRLFYEVMIEQPGGGEGERGGSEGSSMRLPARPSSASSSSPDNEASAGSETDAGRSTESSSSAAGRQEKQPAPPPGRSRDLFDDAPSRGGGEQQQSDRQHPDPSRRPERQKRSVRSSGRGGSDGGQQQSASPAGGEEQAEEEEAPVQNPFAIPGLQKSKVDSQLNDSYTFERFIEGDCNQLARGASWAIAQEPGATRFNPFLVYGGVGLGKTHLIQAIGNYAEQTHGAETVLYVSSERFTTEFVQAIQNNRINEFSMFYRQIDLLIVDDVQFFSGKEKTQEEFFHIFNALHQAGKQIVLSADRSPREIDGIEERLLSRFGWGLSADVQPPELETRIAILRRKAEDEGIELPEEIIEFMAHNIKSNIRDLEGALIRLMAHASLHERDLDLSLAKDVLNDLVSGSRSELTVEEIQRIVCEHLAIDCKQLTGHSLKTIGLHFGGRDHSTVIHSNKRVEEQMEVDPQYEKTVEDLRRKIELRSR